MRNILMVSLLILFAFSMVHCGGKPSPQGTIMKGEKTVCILFNDKKFKNEVIEKVSLSLQEKGYTVILDRPKNADNYSSKDYGAVIYMAEFQMWHTPRNAVSYYKKNNRANNIIFVITSGDPHVVIKKPFDAITSPSRMKDAESLSNKILIRLGTILGK
jgi:hypothetical protein